MGGVFCFFRLVVLEVPSDEVGGGSQDAVVVVVLDVEEELAVTRGIKLRDVVSPSILKEEATDDWVEEVVGGFRFENA